MNEVFTLQNVRLGYGKTSVLENINLGFLRKRVTCIIGPSGSGKTTLLRTLNRMNDHIPGFRRQGAVLFEKRDIYGIAPHHLRGDVGMVFQKPCIFPKSIYDNVLFGVRRLQPERRKDFPLIVETSLKAAYLWKELRHKLHHSALDLSQGQQQRLSIARALSVNPRVLLVDEPTSSLDHKSARAIETLVRRLSREITVIMITHKLDQAKRIADHVVFICNGGICESAEAGRFFQKPQNMETRCYLEHDGQGA